MYFAIGKLPWFKEWWLEGKCKDFPELGYRLLATIYSKNW